MSNKLFKLIIGNYILHFIYPALRNYKKNAKYNMYLRLIGHNAALDRDL